MALNDIGFVPECLSGCSNLEKLDLSNNAIHTAPDSLGSVPVFAFLILDFLILYLVGQVRKAGLSIQSSI